MINGKELRTRTKVLKLPWSSVPYTKTGPDRRKLPLLLLPSSLDAAEISPEPSVITEEIRKNEIQLEKVPVKEKTEQIKGKLRSLFP